MNSRLVVNAISIAFLMFSNMKKMLRILVTLATFSGLAHGAVFIDTGFEGSTSLPVGWAQSNVSGSATWKVQQGGDAGGSSPSTARSGTNNATLYVTNTNENKTRLTSPVFNTVGYTNLSLTFWHTQALWSPDQDELKVFFSSDGGTNWTQLVHYTTSVTTWTQRTLVIPSASANSRIMFEGNAKYGHGVCLDDIQVTGVPASISELSVSATDASASEVGTDLGTWTITRIGNTTGAVSVNFTLSGTATINSDYNAAPSTPINFAAGETSKVITLTPIDDVVGSEGDELATLTLTSGTGYAIGTASGSISIYDDEGYDLNVLVIGSTRDSSEQFGGTSKPFSPIAIGTQLRSILAGSGLGSVNVVVTDCYATGTTVMGSNTSAYNLASWFHWPFPKGAESARWANLRGEAGTDWDYVVLIDDPYTMENTPGVYAYGAAKIAEEVAKGSAETILLMPWPASGSSRNIEHYKNVVYRAGRSGGSKVAPGGLAWQAIKGSALTTSNPDADGAFIAAASIYSTIYNQSAAASTYVYNDTWANTVNTTETNNRNAPQYTGAFSFQNPYLFRSDSKRKIYFSSRGTSTEGYFQGAANSAIGRCRVSVASYCPWNRSETDWTNNGGDEPWTKWPADFVPPIAWNDGRDGATAEWYKSYQVNPTYWDFAYGYIYQANTWSKPLEDANDHFVSMMFAQDNELAKRMMSQGNSARNLPVRTLWAQIHKEFPSENPLMDGSGPHLNQLEHEAVGTYMYTLYSGRCPLDPQPATLDKTWVARKIGYETAWRLGRCQMRAPGFKVMPSAANKLSITPGTTETMTVQFILPPKQDVTVNVSISNSNAAVVGSQQLVFTPQNYNIPQNVVVTGLPGSSASETFNVGFTTVSTDEVCNGLSDTWDYTITRSAPVTLTRVNKTTIQTTAYQNLPVTINLNTTGASSSNTTLAGPSRGTVTWSGSNVIYTPGSDFVGKDGFSFATNIAGTLSVGYVEITVTTAGTNGMVSYRGNGSGGGAVPIDTATYAQNATVTVLGNTGNLTRSGYNFAGWNTAVNGSGTNYAAGATFTMGASGMILYAKWIAVPTYTVTYNGNSNTSGSVPYDQTKTDGINLTLANNIGTLARTNYNFAGWNTAADGTGTNYAVGSTYSSNANLSLYAKWTLATYNVTYNANTATSGAIPANQIKTYGVTLALQSNSGNLAKAGYAFAGWNSKADGTGTNYAPGANYTGNAALTLYAKWTILPYTTWTTGTFANAFTNTASTSNPDGDNLTNLQEFAFGTDPTFSSTALLSYIANGTTNPGIPILENTGTPSSPSFRAVFARRKNHATAGISYEVQFSANLLHWKTSSSGMTVLSGTSTSDVEAVSVPFPATVPLSSAETEHAAPQFFRVMVSGN